MTDVQSVARPRASTPRDPLVIGARLLQDLIILPSHQDMPTKVESLERALTGEPLAVCQGDLRDYRHHRYVWWWGECCNAVNVWWLPCRLCLVVTISLDIGVRMLQSRLCYECMMLGHVVSSADRALMNARSAEDTTWPNIMHS